MPLAADEIRGRLIDFVVRWREYEGSERAGAQSFLDELLRCYGTDRFEVAKFEEPAGSGLVDMIWPGVCVVEMKRPTEAHNLAAHHAQALGYWQQFSRETGNAGRYVVVCSFRRFDVLEPGSRWDVPVATFDLDVLPDRVDALGFLGGRETVFAEDRAELTREAVALVTDLYGRLGDRRAAGAETLRDLVLQCVWCMFAEDLGMIPERRFRRVVEGLIESPRRSSLDDLGDLFTWLNTPGDRPEHGAYPACPTRMAASSRNPPASTWSARSSSLSVRHARGSGNFLYVAYRELRRIEASLRAEERRLRREAGLTDTSDAPPYTLGNIYGIELEPFAVKLARVTLWMAHKLAAVEFALDEQVLPLTDLSGIRRADALKVEWPRANAIVGNPPYHGSQQIRSELGDDYAEWLKREFGVGLKDYAVYWFRKAHEALPDGGRAGLVATNSVSQGRSREASLQWIVENGGLIVNAVSKQPWSGAAVVNVSIVNWIKHPGSPPARAVLDGVAVERISPSLTAGAFDVATASRLAANCSRAFQGPIPAGAGFVLDDEEARGAP